LRHGQFSTVDQVCAQDFVEDVNSGYTARTQDERPFQKEKNFSTSSSSQDVGGVIPSINEDVPSPSPDHIFTISEDDPCLDLLMGRYFPTISHPLFLTILWTFSFPVISRIC